MLELILSVSFAIIISACCSLAEAVLYSVPLRHVETLVRENRPGGKVLKELRTSIERPITAILSLNTIANTAGAAVAGAAVTAVFGHRWIGYFSAFFTLAILILSEVIPKTAGVVYARPLSSWIALPLKGLVRIMTPAIWLCSHITKLIGGRMPDDISSDELKVMAQLSMQTGSIKPFQKSVIENVLSLEAKTVREVMTPRTVIFSLSEHLTLREAQEASSHWEHSRCPVYDKDEEDIVGVVLTREVFIALAEGREGTVLTDLMRPVNFVVETARLNNVLMQFIESREKLFVVLDEYGGISGLVTLEDILEEILGREIVDESDQVVDKRELARGRRKKIISKT